jgi:alkanesulfonate monooxygenase SsuD/methylene tetrahydromethanopterin reductase-like flavin-dependent oxidoreductase (luciferase family)
MRIGIGLPAAVPGTPATALGEWAAESERLGFRSLGVLDRLVYDNLDPLVALAAAAARTEHAELITTVLTVPYRRNAVALAKQLASVDQLSGGRLTAGLGLGGWPEDYAASQAPLAGRGATFDDMLATMRRAWAGEIADEYLLHYYGEQYFAPARADTLTTRDHLRTEIRRLSDAGCDDLLLFPCSGDLEQVALVAEAHPPRAPFGRTTRRGLAGPRSEGS